jgi:hypothetical protein
MTQFKEHEEVERPTWLGEQWEDNSWHNDAMPHASLYLREAKEGDTYPMPTVEVWVNYPKPDDREIGTRYEFVFCRDWAGESGRDLCLWRGEDEEIAKIWERAARSAKSMIGIIVTRPDLMACTTFAQLHDHCDANVLGDAEEVIVEGEAHRTASDDPEVSITGWTHAVHEACIDIVEAWIQSRQ